jgi:hypothetical protein
MIPFVVCGRFGDSIVFVGEGVDVHDGEDGHLDAEKHGWDADLEVGVVDLLRWLEGIGGGQDRDQKL